MPLATGNQGKKARIIEILPKAGKLTMVWQVLPAGLVKASQYKESQSRPDSDISNHKCAVETTARAELDKSLYGTDGETGFVSFLMM